MRQALQTLILLILLFPVEQVYALELTLKQAVEQALATNPGVEAKLLLLEQASMDIGVAQSYFWPRVSLVANTNRLENQGAFGSVDDLSSTTDSSGIRLTLSLFAGFAHLNSLQKSKISKEIAREHHRQAKMELISNVQLQFLQLLKARADMEHVNNSIKRLKTQLEAAEEFVRVGMAPYINVLQNQVDLADVLQQKIRIANQIRGCEVQLNRYLGYAANTPVNYIGILEKYGYGVDYSEEQAILIAMKKRPDLIVAQKSIEVAVKNSEVTAGAFLPKVDATYDNRVYHRDYAEPQYKDYSRSYWSVGLNFNWDVFEGGATTFRFAGDRKKIRSLQKEFEDSLSSAKADVIKSIFLLFSFFLTDFNILFLYPKFFHSTADIVSIMVCFLL